MSVISPHGIGRDCPEIVGSAGLQAGHIRCKIPLIDRRVFLGHQLPVGNHTERERLAIFKPALADQTSIKHEAAPQPGGIDVYILGIIRANQRRRLVVDLQQSFPGGVLKTREHRAASLIQSAVGKFVLNASYVEVGVTDAEADKVAEIEISQAIQDPLGTIVQSVRAVLEKTPPELASDVIDRGIVLTGGGALLRHLDELLTQETGVPCYVADNPLECVAICASIALDHLDIIERALPTEEENLVGLFPQPDR